MDKNWNFVRLPDLYYNEKGYLIMMFHSFKDKEAILMKGLSSIQNMMLLRDWTLDFNLKRDMLRTIPMGCKKLKQNREHVR